MEKYCKSCGAVFNDLKFKICPHCGQTLDTRYGRQPIPRKLRHEVFMRDGYRCRECGASKDETSLEIDHIVPVARGGTNDIDNLQTLCRECNRMKHTDTWVGGETDLEAAQNELNNLNSKLKENEFKLKEAKNEDEKIEYQYRIIKLKEKINDIENTIKQQEDCKNKEELFKKLYVELNDSQLDAFSIFGINYNNKEDFIRFLINKYDENQIYNFLSFIERKKRLIKSLMERIDYDFLPFLCEYIGNRNLSKTDKNKTVIMLLSRYSEEDIHKIISAARIKYSKRN